MRVKKNCSMVHNFDDDEWLQYCVIIHCWKLVVGSRKVGPVVVIWTIILYSCCVMMSIDWFVSESTCRHDLQLEICIECLKSLG